MRHRATTRYKYGKHKGKTINQKEIQRRIAQSYGYTHSINRDINQNQSKIGETEFVA